MRDFCLICLISSSRDSISSSTFTSNLDDRLLAILDSSNLILILSKNDGCKGAFGGGDLMLSSVVSIVLGNG